MMMVAGLIAVAVANEMVIVHPQAPASLPLSLLLAGGPILFLAAQGWYLMAILNVRSQLHQVAGRPAAGFPRHTRPAGLSGFDSRGHKSHESCNP